MMAVHQHLNADSPKCMAFNSHLEAYLFLTYYTVTDKRHPRLCSDSRHDTMPYRLSRYNK